MRLLLVEDDPRIAEPTLLALREAGYAVTWAKDGPAGLEAAMLGDFPLVVLDVMLPGQDGFSVARELRRAGIESPILFLTARGEVADRVTGLDLGGDAYMVKPFALPELLGAQGLELGAHAGVVLDGAQGTKLAGQGGRRHAPEVIRLRSAAGKRTR